MSMDPHDPTTAPTDPVVALAPVVPVVVTTRAKRGWLDWLLGAALVLAIGGVAFAVGRTTAPASAAVSFPGGALPNGGFGVRPGASLDPNASFAPGGGPVGGGPAGRPGFLGAGGLAIDGTVTSIDGTSLTLTLDSGETMTFGLDGATTYHEAASAGADAVAVGDDVWVRVSGGGVPAGNGGAGGAADSVNLTATDITVTP